MGSTITASDRKKNKIYIVTRVDGDELIATEEYENNKKDIQSKI